MKTLHPDIKLLLRMIDEAYNKKAWHGPNLRGALRGLTAQEAAWRPAPRRHNIWEIVVHAAYWKYAVCRRIVGDKKASFSHRGSNWFRLPFALNDKAWRADIALLEEQHRILRRAIEELPAADLNRPGKGSRQINAVMIQGIALHDVYHAGQIQLLKKLHKKRRR